MLSFTLLAIVLTVVAIGVVVVPLVRGRAGHAAPAAWKSAAAAGAVIVVGAATLYPLWSTFTWESALSADDPQGMVARLARRLESNPNDVDGWLLLGRSYVVLEQYPLAIRAYDRANKAAQGKNFDALVGLAEALALPDESALTGRAGELLEQALELQPKSAKALFYGAAAALRRGELPLARQRFSDLLAMQPPQNVRPLLQQQIDAIDAQLAGKVVPNVPPAQGAQASSAPSPADAVRVNVRLAPALAAQATQSTPLFVFVRDPDRPGPPLAAKRLSSHFPQKVELTPADAMLPGRSFAAGQQVEVIARISRSGAPTEASGDPYGKIRYHVGRDGLVDIVIDQLTP